VEEDLKVMDVKNWRLNSKDRGQKKKRVEQNKVNVGL
jgi:hypothetical protein